MNKQDTWILKLPIKKASHQSTWKVMFGKWSLSEDHVPSHCPQFVRQPENKHKLTEGSEARQMEPSHPTFVKESQVSHNQSPVQKWFTANHVKN